MLKKKKGAGGLRLLTSDYTAKLQVIKIVQQWHKIRNLDQWNTKESPEINPRTYEYLIFDKGGKNMKWGKDSPFNKWWQENWSAIDERVGL